MHCFQFPISNSSSSTESLGNYGIFSDEHTSTEVGEYQGRNEKPFQIDMQVLICMQMEDSRFFDESQMEMSHPYSLDHIHISYFMLMLIAPCSCPEANFQIIKISESSHETVQHDPASVNG